MQIMPNIASTTIAIENRLGMHARPAMMFVEVASRFESSISVRRTDQSEVFDGKSIMQVMMLAATQGTEIEVTAKGDDAPDALAELVKLVRTRFDED